MYESDVRPETAEQKPEALDLVWKMAPKPSVQPEQYPRVAARQLALHRGGTYHASEHSAGPNFWC